MIPRSSRCTFDPREGLLCSACLTCVSFASAVLEPGLSIKTKTCRAVGRPKKRWEDEINDLKKLKRQRVMTQETMTHCSRKRKTKKDGKRTHYGSSCSIWRPTATQKTTGTPRRNSARSNWNISDVTLQGWNGIDEVLQLKHSLSDEREDNEGPCCAVPALLHCRHDFLVVSFVMPMRLHPDQSVVE